MIDDLIFWAPVFATLTCVGVLLLIDWRYRQLVAIADDVRIQSAVVAQRSEDLVVAATLMGTGDHADAVALLRRWEIVDGGA